MTEYIKNQLIKLCDNPEWFNDMLNTWDFKPERESQAIKEYLTQSAFNPQLNSQNMKLNSTIPSDLTITINDYPIGWEWLDKVPLEDFTWLIEIFATMTDNTDTYDFVGYTDSETLPGQQKVCSVDKIPLANFLNEDQGYKSGISMYGHYIACKCLDISSEREYMNQYTDIRILTNELESC